MAKRKSVLTRAVHRGVNAIGHPQDYVRIGGRWWSVFSRHTTKRLARSKLERLKWMFPRSASMRVVKISSGWAVVQLIGKEWEHRHKIGR